MSIVKLITRADFTTESLEIPASLSDARLFRAIIETQEKDLKEKLGEAFYYDILKSPTASNYVTLLAGEEYTDIQTNVVSFSGLKMCLIYWTYARILSKNQKTLTSHGYVYKTNSQSTSVDPKELARDIDENKSFALVYWANVEKYLNTKYTTFPKWNKTTRDMRRSGSVRINAIGGNDNYTTECNDLNTK